LYFYPKDNTPGCSKQAHDFTTMNAEFVSLWAQIIGVSKDSHKSHCSFIDKQWIPFDLVSDPERIVHKQFDTVGEKSMYGRKYQWTIRSTFLLDQQGSILQEWRDVSVTDHVKTVLSALKQIKS
jgi:peroxiredoxin Q/BCP